MTPHAYAILAAFAPFALAAAWIAARRVRRRPAPECNSARSSCPAQSVIGAQARGGQEHSDRAIEGAAALLIDDNEINLMVLEAFLQRYRLGAVVCVTSGVAALDLLKTREFDIVFLDIQMPQLDGLETARLIRNLDGKNAALPILAVTANARKLSEAAIMAAGFDGMIEKPLRENELELAIRNVASRVKSSPVAA